MQKVHNKRRTFTVKEQLVGKYGPREFGRLLGSLEALATEPPKKRRRQPRAKVAA